MADEHYHRNILKKYLNKWMTYTNHKYEKILKESYSMNFYHLKLLRSSFNALLNYKNYKKEKFIKQQKAAIFFRTQSYRRVLAGFQINLQSCSANWTKAKKFRQKHMMQIKFESFAIWREMINIWRTEKTYMEVAEIYSNGKLAEKIMNFWRQLTIRRKNKRKEREIMTIDCQEKLNAICLKYYFNFWRKKRDISLMNRLNYERAFLRSSYSLKQKALKSWVLYIQMKKIHTTMKRQGKNFFCQNLLKRVWLNWRGSIILKHKENSQIAIALWHWSMRLQWKSLVTWKKYLEKKKYKNEMYKLALEEYRNRVVKTAVSDWVKTADAMQNLKRKLAFARSESECQREYLLTLKVISHWKFWASKKSNSKKAEPKIITGNLGNSTKTKLKVQFAIPIISNSLPLIKSRDKPRKPDFLLDSLKRDGLLFESAKDDCTSQEIIEPIEFRSSPSKCVNKSVLKSSNLKVQLSSHFPSENNSNRKVNLLPPAAFMTFGAYPLNLPDLEEEVIRIKNYLENYKLLRQRLARNEEMLQQLQYLKENDHKSLEAEILKEIDLVS